VCLVTGRTVGSCFGEAWFRRTRCSQGLPLHRRSGSGLARTKFPVVHGYFQKTQQVPRRVQVPIQPKAALRAAVRALAERKLGAHRPAGAGTTRGRCSSARGSRRGRTTGPWRAARTGTPGPRRLGGDSPDRFLFRRIRTQAAPAGRPPDGGGPAMGRGEPTHRQMRAWERRRTRGLEGRDIVGICGILGPDLAEMQIRERGPFAGGPQAASPTAAPARGSLSRASRPRSRPAAAGPTASRSPCRTSRTLAGAKALQKRGAAPEGRPLFRGAPSCGALVDTTARTARGSHPMLA